MQQTEQLLQKQLQGLQSEIASFRQREHDAAQRLEQVCVSGFKFWCGYLVLLVGFGGDGGVRVCVSNCVWMHMSLFGWVGEWRR